MELLSVWLAGALFLGVLALVLRSHARPAYRGALVAGMLLAGVGLARRPAHPRRLDVAFVKETHERGYLGSGACRPCHPAEHASWTRTYHRTMTQRSDNGPVVLTTGSHHMTVSWVERDGELALLPQVFLRAEQRFIDRREAFLQPADASQAMTVDWRTNCLGCHTTGGEPRSGERAARVGELGIACEACHGPGAEHAARERSPIARWTHEPPGEIVNPARLDHVRSSAVCGACHSYSFPRDPARFLVEGSSYRPGDAFERARILLTPDVLARGEVTLDTDARNLFWPDGSVRVGGREYNGMVLSACFLRGELSCLSCHSMHASDPDDQLRRDRAPDEVCRSCHTMPNDHTHHERVACVDCHMPKTSYALRNAIRSHRIDSPREGTGKPSACALCHLDRTRAWVSRALAERWGAPAASHDDELPESVAGLLAASAAERVVWADAFAQPAAARASGRDWEGAVLERARRDPYAVIRAVAERSAHTYPPSTRLLVPPSVLDGLPRDDRPVSIAE